MTAFSRLWSRAPLWRAALLLALGTTAFATLYPPPFDVRAPQPRARYMATPSPAAPPSAPANAVAAMTPTPSAGVVPDAPAFGSTVAGVISFAGHAVPLPAGDWLTIAAIGGKLADGNATNGAMFAQVAGGHATAFVVLTGVGVPSRGGNGFPRFPGCEESRNLYSRIFVARAGGEQACWSVDAASIPWDDTTYRLRAAGVGELRQRGATLPEVVLRTRLLRADKNHLLIYELYQAVDVPPEGTAGWDWSHVMATPDRLARATQVRDWAAAWWPLVDRGFSGHLQATGVPLPGASLPF